MGEAEGRPSRLSHREWHEVHSFTQEDYLWRVRVDPILSEGVNDFRRGRLELTGGGFKLQAWLTTMPASTFLRLAKACAICETIDLPAQGGECGCRRPSEVGLDRLMGFWDAREASLLEESLLSWGALNDPLSAIVHAPERRAALKTAYSWLAGGDLHRQTDFWSEVEL